MKEFCSSRFQEWLSQYSSTNNGQLSLWHLVYLLYSHGIIGGRIFSFLDLHKVINLHNQC